MPMIVLREYAMWFALGHELIYSRAQATSIFNIFLIRLELRRNDPNIYTRYFKIRDYYFNYMIIIN